MSGSRGVTSSGERIRLPTFADLVGEVAVFREQTWGCGPVVFPGVADPGLITVVEVWSMLDCGLLVTPYFEMIAPGERAPLPGVTEIRAVINRPMPGYASSDAIRVGFETGATLVLHQPEDWHSGIKALLADIRVELQAGARSYLLLSPPGELATVDVDTQQLRIQLDGVSEGLLSDGTDAGTRPVMLHTGDVSYLPPGAQLKRSAGAATSLELVIEVNPVTALDLAELTLADFLASRPADEIAGTHHGMTMQQKVGWLRTGLGAHLAEVDCTALTQRAIRFRQRGGQA